MLMKKFTLVAILLLSVAFTATAKEKLGFVKAQSRDNVKAMLARTPRQAARNMLKQRANDAAAPIYRAVKQEAFFYMEGEWLPVATYTIAYNAEGKMTSMTGDEDGSFVRTLFYYGNGTYSEVNQYDDSGNGEWVNSDSTAYVYDPIVGTCTAEKSVFSWNVMTNSWDLGATSFKRAITRDASNNVTEMMISVPWQGAYEDIERTQITYGADGKAATHTFQQFDPMISNWGDATTYKNIEWDRTDGQLVGDFEGMVLGENRIKKAEYYEADEKMSDIAVEYVDGKEDFSLVNTMTDGSGCEKHELVVTDGLGSFVETIKSYMDMDGDAVLTEEEMMGGGELTVTYNEHGHEVLYEEKELFGTEEPVVIGGSRNTYTYDSKYGSEPVEFMTEMYETESDADGNVVSGAYVPFMKIVSSEFADVTAAISNVSVEGNAAAGVYNLQGVRVADTARNLAKGVYVVKQGGATKKLFVK